MRHLPDSSGRCIVCGRKADDQTCTGIPTEDEIDTYFLPADPACDECCEGDDAFTHDPDAPAFNVICPVCGCRPCLPSCRLGPWTSAELEALNRLFPEDK